MKTYSLGTSIRTTEEFLGIGRTYDIKVMADMRSFPQRRFAHFNQIELAWQLRRWGIEYLYLGKELGGYRRGGYKSYVDNPLSTRVTKAREDSRREGRRSSILSRK